LPYPPRRSLPQPGSPHPGDPSPSPAPGEPTPAIPPPPRLPHPGSPTPTPTPTRAFGEGFQRRASFRPDMNRIPGIFTYKNEAYVIPIHRGMEISGILDDEMNCDFFMWCDKVQSFVETTTTWEKDEKIKKLENRIAWLEDELRGSKSLINKAKVVVQSLPKTFVFLSILDKDGGDGSDGDSHSQEDMNVHLD
ncbi:hypothetical protein Taro_004146, partial [Colocasia esculenta]|nr:hypothetical protein [Colocasia esculenta]